MISREEKLKINQMKTKIIKMNNLEDKKETVLVRGSLIIINFEIEMNGLTIGGWKYYFGFLKSSKREERK